MSSKRVYIQSRVMDLLSFNKYQNFKTLIIHESPDLYNSMRCRCGRDSSWFSEDFTRSQVSLEDRVQMRFTDLMIENTEPNPQLPSICDALQTFTRANRRQCKHWLLSELKRAETLSFSTCCSALKRERKYKRVCWWRRGRFIEICSVSAQWTSVKVKKHWWGAGLNVTPQNEGTT